jgi:hypothetical protein
MMAVFLFLALAFIFLLAGSIQFLLCVATPQFRRFALSAALWWAVCGACFVGLCMLGGLAVIVAHLPVHAGETALVRVQQSLKGFGRAYLILGTIGTLSVATTTAWLHQQIVRRFTFALFRVYATVVSAGIGSVFGWALGWWIVAEELRFGWLLWTVAMAVLLVSFGLFAYRGSRGLRGGRPTRFTWISAEEYDGR